MRTILHALAALWLWPLAVALLAVVFIGAALFAPVIIFQTAREARARAQNWREDESA